jgi:hypothetical protein
MSETKSTTPSAPLTLTPEALQSLISSAVATAIQESKKPAPPTKAEIANLEQEQQLRLETAKNVLAQMDTKKFEQRSCSHRHATGESHGVYINDGNYVLCQKCQAKVRPFVAVESQKDKTAIYDTDLFNRLFQELSRTDM